MKNVTSVRSCIQLDGLRAVREIVAISEAGRAPKNDPALYALAACISLGNVPTRKAAALALPRVARTATHLYHFIAYMETMRGWGKLPKRAVRGWVEAKGADGLAYQAVKYRQRDGWSFADVLRTAHVRTSDPATRDVLGFISGNVAHVRGDGDRTESTETWGPPSEITPRIIEGYLKAQESPSAARTAALVREYNLPREALLTEHLNSNEVWEAMLDQGMPMGALIRNLATMTRNGLLTATSSATATVIAQLADDETIRKARIHPIAVLIAQLTYRSGVSVRGSNTWTPVTRIVDALDGAFYSAFGNVTPTGKRTLLALDVSGSMSSGAVAGVPGLTPRVASAAMAMVTARTEAMWECVGFSHTMMPLSISPRQRLDDIVRTVSGLPFGGTDCALPMIYAHETKQDFDTFVVYTDSETWAGYVHPAQALRSYRAEHVPDAKLVVCGMVSNNFTIADPNDAGMMDVVGFDTATPEVISGFARGDL
jgi:60 kDa SS-A/Ro ribonucleoprotein